MTHAHATLRAYERAAGAALDPALQAYFLQGAGDQTTLHRNIAHLQDITLLPKVLADLRDGGTECDLLGSTFGAPILAAPMAYLTLLHAEAECGVAAAATAQGCGMTLSMQASQPMRDVRNAGENCAWMQMYWQATPDANMTFAARAAECGFKVLVLTVDAPINGVRDAEIEAGFALPDEVSAVNQYGMPQPRFAPLAEHESMIFDRISHILPRWEDVKWFCKNAPLPVVLKGITHPDDARQAADAGASGIIVSNHGGRVLDGGPSAISVLPAIVEAINGALPVLMDSGIRRGADIFKALALGADAVLVGRPICHGLAVGGAQGVSHILRLLRDELEVAMALTGCARLADISPDKVHMPHGLLIA